MVHYLNGLALVANEDGNICEKEREYLSILINSFGLSEDMLETFVNFAENPDEKLILDMMQSFNSKDIKYNFMIDCMMIANANDDFDESKEAIIEEYFKMLKITALEAFDLRDLYKKFYTQNGHALLKYFGLSKDTSYSLFKTKVENFQYLIDYYKINFAYELAEEVKNEKILNPNKPVKLKRDYYKHTNCASVDLCYSGTSKSTMTINLFGEPITLKPLISEPEDMIEANLDIDSVLVAVNNNGKGYHHTAFSRSEARKMGVLVETDEER